MKVTVKDKCLYLDRARQLVESILEKRAEEEARWLADWRAKPRTKWGKAKRAEAFPKYKFVSLLHYKHLENAERFIEVVMATGLGDITLNDSEIHSLVQGWED